MNSRSFINQMTVHELITQLQDCDSPDAEVVINAKHQFTNGERGQTIAPVTEVYFNESTGPVCIEGVSQL